MMVRMVCNARCPYRAFVPNSRVGACTYKYGRFDPETKEGYFIEKVSGSPCDCELDVNDQALID